MVFNSTQFLVFFPIIFSILLIIPKRFRMVWLLGCSYYFYMCWNIKYILLIVYITVITYLIGIALEKTKIKKILLIFSISFILLTLFVFKYYNFAISSIQNVALLCGFKIETRYLDLILPVGISFYSFQAIGYVIDIYRGEKAEHNFVKYALFISFFPQLVAGPIERYGNLAKQITQLENKKIWNYKNIYKGLFFIGYGLFEKCVIADRAALFVDKVYLNYEHYGMTVIVAATVLFAFQIYCDFEGYTYIARGTAKIIGIDLMANFKQPYLANNIKDFWSRWHISLTSWFRDYLYIPMGGNRKGKLRQYINIFIVFLLSGLWHGANWTYVIWGLIHGVLLVIYNILHKKMTNKRSFSQRIRNVLLNFALVDIAWIFFRAPTISIAFSILNQMMHVLGDFTGIWNLLGDGDRNLLLYSLAILFVIDCLKEKRFAFFQWMESQEVWFRYTIYIGLACLCFFGAVRTVGNDVQNFIYFQF